MYWLQGDRRRVAFWRLTRIRWGLGSSLMKHYLPSFPSCLNIRNECEGHIWLSLSSPTWLFCQSWTWWNVSGISWKVHIWALLGWWTILGAVLSFLEKDFYPGNCILSGGVLTPQMAQWPQWKSSARPLLEAGSCIFAYKFHPLTKHSFHCQQSKP